MHVSRRSFLTKGLLGTLVGVCSTSAQETRMRITPTTRDKHAHGVTDPEAQVDPIQQALKHKVTTLKGMDPLRYLTAFDYGVTRTLPGGRVLREFRLVAEDVELEVAPGIMFSAWTYNGTVPGPTLRCVEGDLVRVHFFNRSISEHTIHFHGIHPADMDGAVEIVNPGGKYTYEFTAEPFGLQFYHCHVAPVSLHMNRGLFGAFIIDPKSSRPKAKEMVMIAHGWDTNFDGINEVYALNGAANFFRDNPITIQMGDLVRIYFVNALEYDPINSFHLHANFFHVYRTGSKLSPDDYTDMITLSQAERCVIEFTYNHPGRFMFHAHQNNFAELGWMGHFDVGPPAGKLNSSTA